MKDSKDLSIGSVYWNEYKSKIEIEKQIIKILQDVFLMRLFKEIIDSFFLLLLVIIMLKKLKETNAENIFFQE